MAGLQTTFGALLADPATGSWALYDAANKTLVMGTAPYLNNASKNADAGVVLPVQGGAASAGPARQCLGNGYFGPTYYNNYEDGYLSFAVSSWLYDPDFHHCYPVSFNGQVGSRSMCDPALRRNDTDATNPERSSIYPDGLKGTTLDTCCAACDKAADCIAFIFADSSHPDPNGNCWPLAGFDDTHANAGRIFAAAAPQPPVHAWWAMGEAADWYLAPSTTPLSQYAALYQLSGTPAIPPRYAFGFMGTYWGWSSMEEVEGNMTAFRDGNYPADTIIMDYDWWNTAANKDLDFDYDPKMFGNHSFVHQPGSTVPNASTSGAKELFAHFHNDINFKFCGIRKPRSYSNIALSNASGWLLPNSFDVGAGDNNWNMTAPGFAEWYTAGHLHFLEDGLDCWWNDEGETQWFTYTWWNRAQQQQYNLTRPGKRFFTINRSFQPSMQSFPAISWTGDRQDCSHKTVLTFTNAGQLYTACDGTAPSGTVLLRQYWNAVFMPVMRIHAMHGTPRFPFMPEWGGAEHQAGFRAALNTRYAFLPYIYSLSHAARRNLQPIVMPASYWYFNDPSFPASIADDTYMMGDSLLPADVSTSTEPDPGENTTHVNLPPGAWYAFNSTAALQGPMRNLTYTDVPLNKLILFVREGSVLTLQRSRIQHAGDLGGALDVHVYAGRDCTFVMVEDDGETLAYQVDTTASLRTTTFMWTESKAELSWTVQGTFTGPNVYSSMGATLFRASAPGPVFKGDVPLGTGGAVVF